MMRKVKIDTESGPDEFQPSLKSFLRSGSRRIMEKELEFFRHRCDDSWFESLLVELNLEKRKITPSRMRKIIAGAIRKRMETGSRGY
jgi:hypothetical protein